MTTGAPIPTGGSAPLPGRTARPASSEAQLAALAAAADRANRPTGMIVLTALLAGIGLAFLLVSLAAYSRSKSEYRVNFETATRTRKLLADIDSLRQLRPDVNKLYPPTNFMTANISEVAQQVWGSAALSSVRIGDAQISPLPFSEGVDRATVQCVIDSQPLEKILRWIDEVPKHKGFMDGGHKVFVSQFTVQPSGPGWQANINYTMFQGRPEFKAVK
ncbi:MAG: hypothetical protein IBJ11_03990 [Phycisphaerales bacterium]|nr:hypothetical protein [Phycisphaerales bacterium]